MILSVEELRMNLDCGAVADEQLEAKLKGIESAIRGETNNNFQNRKFRFNAPTNNSALLFKSPYFAVGDTIHITQSVNEGLYVITSVEDDMITLDKPVFPAKSNLVTKVEYDDNVKMGVVNLMKWELSMRDKVGVSSETISRHSVTYFSQDTSNMLMGYPKALTGFLEPYYKARF